MFSSSEISEQEEKKDTVKHSYDHGIVLGAFYTQDGDEEERGKWNMGVLAMLYEEI